MTLHMTVVLVVVGLLVAWLAGHLMKNGGYGVMGDVGLGVAGSLLGGALFLGLGAGPGWFVVLTLASMGALLFIVFQRVFMQATKVQ